MTKRWHRDVLDARRAAGAGKVTRGAVYLHASATGALPPTVARVVREAAAVGDVGPSDWNVLKLATGRDRGVTFLRYADFWRDPFPRLARSITVDVARRTARRADYDARGNPPILHRKEELIPAGHPARPGFEAATRRLEERGAFAPDKLHCIGHRRQWEAVLASKPNGAAVPLPSSCASERTALRQVPALLKALAESGDLKPGSVNADIGGGPYDLATEHLAARGVRNVVYDCALPEERVEAFRRAIERRRADTATLANVLNVIRSAETRREVLELARASVRPGGRVWVAVHPGDGSGRGRSTAKGWQENRGIGSYVREVSAVFPGAKLTTVGRVRAILAAAPNRPRR